MSTQTIAEPGSRLDDLAVRYTQVRNLTEVLCEPLETEDYVVQTMNDVSPTKWHLAHTTWFFETFVLKALEPNHRPFHPEYAYLFNSYYVQAGERHCRDRRGYLSRPTVADVFRYRAHVDERMHELFASLDGRDRPEVASVIEIGLQHEQQHQELLLTDIKHVLSVNPLRPAYREVEPAKGYARDLTWQGFDEGLYEIGHAGEGFAYDNEGPRHRHFLAPFEIAARPVTNGEFLSFIEDDGYRRPELWLSLGWAAVQERQWSEPFYWEKRDGCWHHFTLAGMREVDEDEPAAHISYFEADAFARWAGARLPTEFEWEVASRQASSEGNFAEEGLYHPRHDSHQRGPLRQMFGDVWEWTGSPYAPYPGYRPEPGALGEYNGKWMCGQFVLRGGSCATSASHIRNTYRNFFPPDASWQFTGLRIARDL
jgi:ergothioneine biosynthesis protein EgtB